MISLLYTLHVQPAATFKSDVDSGPAAFLKTTSCQRQHPDQLREVCKERSEVAKMTEEKKHDDYRPEQLLKISQKVKDGMLVMVRVQRKLPHQLVTRDNQSDKHLEENTVVLHCCQKGE